MDFSEALKLAKAGSSISRSIWNTRREFVRLRSPDEHSQMTMAFLYMTAQGKVQPWLPSPADLMAEDWMLPGSRKKGDTKPLDSPG